MRQAKMLFLYVLYIALCCAAVLLFGCGGRTEQTVCETFDNPNNVYLPKTVTRCYTPNQ